MAPRLFPVCSLLVVCTAGCVATDLPGDAVGQYEVRGALAENTCQDGYAVPDDLWFHVELRDEPGLARGYWKLSDAPLAAGRLERDLGTFRFEDSYEVVGLAAQEGYVGCVLERAEVIEGQLVESDTDEPADPRARPVSEARFEGTTSVTVSATSGSDCSPLIDPSQGGFPALPCELRYDIWGDRLAEDLW